MAIHKVDEGVSYNLAQLAEHKLISLKFKIENYLKLCIFVPGCAILLVTYLQHHQH